MGLAMIDLIVFLLFDNHSAIGLTLKFSGTQRDHPFTITLKFSKTHRQPYTITFKFSERERESILTEILLIVNDLNNSVIDVPQDTFYPLYAGKLF